MLTSFETAIYEYRVTHQRRVRQSSNRQVKLANSRNSRRLPKVHVVSTLTAECVETPTSSLVFPIASGGKRLRQYRVWRLEPPANHLCQGYGVSLAFRIFKSWWLETRRICQNLTRPAYGISGPSDASQANSARSSETGSAERRIV